MCHLDVVLLPGGEQALQPALAGAPARAPWEQQPGRGGHAEQLLGAAPMAQAAAGTQGASALPAQEQPAQPEGAYTSAPDQARGEQQQQQAAWATQEWPPQQVLL